MTKSGETKHLLQCRDLTMRFGGLVAVNKFNLKLGDRELVGIIGPNGAGKTTIFNMITGVYTPSSGQVCLEGESLIDLRPYAITQKGVARTFQNIRLFKALSVLDNILIASDWQNRYGLLGNIFRTPKFHKESKRQRERAIELLEIFQLQDKLNTIASNLPYGEQRRLEIVRALATRPKILLLDEPAAGMNPQETAELTEVIRWVRDKFNITILLIEHDMKLVMNVCERIAVVDYGQLIAEGEPTAIQKNPKVIEAYLGTQDTTVE